MGAKVRSDSCENEVISKQMKKKPKIKNDDFEIPRYKEFDWLDRYNYNLNQLRSIARKYKQPISGNKSQLVERIHRYLRSSLHASTIQKVFRGYLQRQYNNTHGPAMFNRRLCNNASDFYSLDDIDDIPSGQFLSYRDEDGFVYGFDILSLYNLILTNGTDSVNPYNRRAFPSNIVDKIRYKIRLSHVLKIPINTVLNTNIPYQTAQQRHELRVLSLFQDIDSLGNYSSPQWFTCLNRTQLVKYLRELMDIWTYRAQLTDEAKIEICPPNGDPLRNMNLNVIHNLNAESLQRFSLGAMENLVRNGTSQDNRALGAYYVLAALTLVNEDAAAALPWLYQSVVQI